MIEVYSPIGIWHVFLYSINTDKNENTYHIRSLCVNTGKATHTFTSVIYVPLLLQYLIFLKDYEMKCLYTLYL